MFVVCYAAGHRHGRLNLAGACKPNTTNNMDNIMYRLLAVHPVCAEWLIELLIVTLLR